MNRDWMLDAECAQVGTEFFFPEKSENAAAALAICARCPVQAPCLEMALAVPYTRDVGVWGGKTATQRRAIRRQRGEVLEEAA